MPSIPKLAVPFRVIGGRPQTVEQDSTEEIANCVWAVLTTPLGSREIDPSFGIPEQVFQQGGVDVDDLRSAIEEQEPRAETALTAGEIEEMAQTVEVNVSGVS